MNKKILILIDDESSENSAHTLRAPHVSEVPDSLGRIPGEPNYGNIIF